KVARGGPVRDGDQGVAAARADVQDPKRPRLGRVQDPKRPRWGRVRDPKRPRWRGVRLDDAGGYAVSYTGSYTVKEGEGVAVGAGEVVELSEVAEEAAELFVGAGTIHELR